MRPTCLPVFLKAVLLNLFVLGLALNLTTLTSINWISGENYVIGLLQYCKGFDQAYAARHYIFYNRGNQLVHKPAFEDVKCYNWEDHNRPRFLQIALNLQYTGIALHCLSLCFVAVFLLLATPTKFISQYRIKLQYLSSCLRHTSDNPHLDVLSFRFGFFHPNALLYIATSGMGFLISTIYCSSLLIFLIDHLLGRIHGKREKFSWCFWASLVGLMSTLIATFAFFVHTIRNKMLRVKKKVSSNTIITGHNPTQPNYNGFRQTTHYNEKFTLTRITSINPLLLNAAAQRQIVRRPSIESSSSNKVCKIHQKRRLWKKNLKKLVSKSVKGLPCEVSVIQPVVNQQPNKSNHFQMYSQVFPINKKSRKNLKHTKMKALPFGSLSGVLLKRSSHSTSSASPSVSTLTAPPLPPPRISQKDLVIN